MRISNHIRKPIVATWSEVSTEQAGELVDASTIRAEADAILASTQGA